MMQKVFVPAMLATLLLAAGTARAMPMEAVEQHSATVSANLPLDFTDYSVNLLLPQINPAHFVSINSIVVTLSGTVQGDYSAYNPRTNNTYNNQIANIQAAITLYSPTSSGGATALGVVIPLFSTNPFILGPKQTVTGGGYDPTENNPGLGITASATTMTTNDVNSTANFAAIAQSFLGYGNVNVPVAASGTSSFSGSSNISFNVDTAASAAITVTVNYTTVPEPSALALIGAALLGTGLLRRKHKGSSHA